MEKAFRIRISDEELLGVSKIGDLAGVIEQAKAARVPDAARTDR